jgi:hypothetical protein
MTAVVDVVELGVVAAAADVAAAREIDEASWRFVAGKTVFRWQMAGTCKVRKGYHSQRLYGVGKKLVDDADADAVVVIAVLVVDTDEADFYRDGPGC